VLNSLNDKGAGFKGDTNKITIFNKAAEKVVFETKSKNEVAKDICNEILKLVL
jgi:phosphopantothenoylcysteine decarboxylase/phosphopantothenate--cysteine ligase